jgi:HD-GYP domain-containing protein (c-di-GMP phosphodiesterase class II)
MEAHSPNLGIHCQRVAELAQILATQVGVDGDDLRDVGFAAQLHDIGQFAKTSTRTPLPASQLGTAMPLRPVSYTETAHALLSKVSGFENIALAVRHVHENFDGTGFPSGLRREEIPLSARIVAIANAYSKGAMSKEDPASYSHQSGCQTLLRGKGTQFDPHLVDQLLRFFGAREAAAHNIHEVEVSSRRLRPGMTLSRPIHSVAGLLMLNENTRLTHELIDSIIRLGDVDPSTRSVFVQCTPCDDNPPAGTPATTPEARVPENLG